MIKKNIELRKNVNELQAGFKDLDLLEKLYILRGELLEKGSDYALTHLLLPEQLKGIAGATDLLVAAIKQKKPILIVGDFDADGATSTAIAVRCLRAMGAVNVDYLVPNRFEYGYGLTPEIVELAKEKSPDLIVTVDNGISSIEGVASARKAGIDVLVTDHHLPGAAAPEANAIVNPNQHDCHFPSKALAGVGVIFYVMLALRAELRRLNWFVTQQIPVPNLANFLDIVALGTVADVVPLDLNNRILVHHGLKRIQQGKCVPGIKALFGIAKKNYVKADSADLGFFIGPRLNAAGRLDDMSLGIRCLLTDSEYEADQLAAELDDLNKERKLIESSMQVEAKKILDAEFLTSHQDNIPCGICLFKDDWHQGVIGILASRIKERFTRPTIIFARDDNGFIKGSGRSIPGIHLRDVLDTVASRAPNLLEKFGGHAMAAGLTIREKDLAAFDENFNAVLSDTTTRDIFMPCIYVDGALAQRDLTLEVAQRLRDSGPWGQSFPEPLFDGEFYIKHFKILADKHLKLRVALLPNAHQTFDAIAFNFDKDSWPAKGFTKIRCVYKLDINEYRDNTNVQLLIHYLEPG